MMNHLSDCNIPMFISSFNTWASGNSTLAQLVKELHLFLFLCVIRRLCDRLPAEPINNLTAHDGMSKDPSLSQPRELKCNNVIM